MSAKRIKQEPNTKKRVPQEPVAVPLKEAKQEKVDIDEMELMTAGLEDDEEGGCYFVDQKGNYYFQASEDAELRAVENGPSDYEPLTGGEQEKTEEEVSYVLIMNDGENKSTIVVNDTDEAGLDPDGKDNEIYDFDDPDYIVPDQEPAAKNKPARAKRGQASTGSMYMCNYCNYTSGKLFLLSRHLKTHSDDRPHKCVVCERGFKTLASLQNHVNTHTGTKPHRCTRSFRHKGNLIRHMALHDPESTMSKELEALREGRQKKVQITFEDELTYKGEEEEYEGEEDEDEEEEGEDEEEEEEEEEDEGQAEDEEEEEDETGMPMETSDMVTVEDEDGQYVVLEVIQLQDKDSKAADSKAPKKRASKRKATATATATPTTTAQPSSSSKTATTTGTTVATPTTSRVTRSVKKEPIELVSSQDHHTLDMDGISLVMVEEDGEDGAQQIVIERESGGQSGDEFILSTEGKRALGRNIPLPGERRTIVYHSVLFSSTDSIDLQHTEMLMSSLQSAKRSRFDVTISQDELEKNMSNCFGFDDDDDEVLDTKATITLLN
uniref:C2H2-type domain-containing protein n=1 Tax=Anopheles stephensi TaxID=30069 RepID=A0A182Y125_ANOST